MKTCKKCDKPFPSRMKINGVYKDFRNRKFCLECSPMGRHNTSTYDPVERVTRIYSKYSEKKKEQIRLCLYRKALERKDNLINMLGGKCKDCGYHKNRKAMTFHHKDRSEKLFGLTINNIWSKPLDVLIKEALKCDLLCMNCHAETEDRLMGVNNIVARVNAKYGTNF